MANAIEKDNGYLTLEPGDDSHNAELRDFSELFRPPPLGPPELDGPPNENTLRENTTLDAVNSGYTEPLLVGLVESGSAPLELALHNTETEKQVANQLSVARFKSEELDLLPFRNANDQVKDLANHVSETFLKPSELSYLPTDHTVSGNQGSLHLPNIPIPQNSVTTMYPTSTVLNRGVSSSYVGSSFLQADDVMVVEPVLHNQGSASSTNDGQWPAVALALPSGAGPVPMKSKRGRARAGRFTCPECNVVFRQTGNLRKHVAEIHQKSKPFRCGVCGNYFSRKHARDTHLKAVHHKLRPFECTLCFKRYKNRSDLNKHMRTVERKEKPHACPICNRAFGERGKLKRHMAIHEKAPPTLNPAGSELSKQLDSEQPLKFGESVLEG